MLCFLYVITIYASYVATACVLMFTLGMITPGNKIHNFLSRITKVLWVHLTKALLYRYFPNKIFIRYDPRVLEKDRNIVISNHLTEYDWVFILSVLHHFNRFEDICVILKMSLRDIPLLGYGMAFLQFIFLNRKLNRDIELIRAGIARLKRNGKYDLLLFPEGTYIDRESHQKSQKWSSEIKAEVEGRRFNPEEVLIPRTTGFKALLENIGDHMDGVLDITMVCNPYVKYPSEAYSYWDTIVNRPCKVNFAFFLDYIPKDDVSSEDFLLTRFEKKERMIAKWRDMRGAEVVTSMTNFQKIADRVVGSSTGYKDVVIDMVTPWSPLIHIAFILGSILVVTSLLGLIFK